MAARTQKKTSSKSTSKSASVGQGSAFVQARRIVETSYAFHLMLLLIMSILAALLLGVVFKQQYTINSLNFQLSFIREKEERTRQWNGQLLEYKSTEQNSDALFDADLESFVQVSAEE